MILELMLEEFGNAFFTHLNSIPSIYRLASKFEVFVNCNDQCFDIEMYDGDIRMGLIEGEVRTVEDSTFLYIPKAAIAKKYQNDGAAATVLFKRFIEMYNQNYKGMPIGALFYNQKLYDKYKSWEARGVFPESNHTIKPEVTDTDYQEWSDDLDYTEFPDAQYKERVSSKLRRT